MIKMAQFLLQRVVVFKLWLERSIASFKTNSCLIVVGNRQSVVTGSHDACPCVGALPPRYRFPSNAAINVQNIHIFFCRDIRSPDK